MVRTQQKESSTLADRVSRTEGSLESLAHEIQETSRNVQEVTKTMSVFKDEVINKIGTLSAPRWPLIISFGSLITAIFGACGIIVAIIFGGQKESLQNVQQQIMSIQKGDIDRAREEGVSIGWRLDIEKRLVQSQGYIDDIKKWRHEEEIVLSKNVARTDELEKQADRQINQLYILHEVLNPILDKFEKMLKDTNIIKANVK